MPLVDVLSPGTFRPTGRCVDVRQAWSDGLWIGTFNLWIVQGDGHGGGWVLYQERSASSLWAPSALDVAVGGHYDAGESLHDGLREAREELGRDYTPDAITFVGRKLHVEDAGDLRIRNVVDVCIIEDGADLEEFTLERRELAGLYRCPVHDLIALHRSEQDSFIAEGIAVDGSHQVLRTRKVARGDFPDNWDPYHEKMAVVCQQFLAGAQRLMY